MTKKQIIGMYLSEIGTKGGSKTSPAKKISSRKNGRLGGRPKSKQGKCR
jgi:hypothetical protein